MEHINRHHLYELLDEKIARSLWQFIEMNLNTCEWKTLSYDIGSGDNVQHRYHSLKHYKLSNVIKICEKNKVNIGQRKSVWKDKWEQVSEALEILRDRS